MDLEALVRIGRDRQMLWQIDALKTYKDQLKTTTSHRSSIRDQIDSIEKQLREHEWYRPAESYTDHPANWTEEDNQRIIKNYHDRRKKK